MRAREHGFSVGIHRVNETFFLRLKPVGKLTHADYGVIIPLLENALEGVKEPKIKALIDGTEFEGWELRAAWDDFKMGVTHAKEFEKVAIVGNKPWEKVVAKIGHWFISGEARYFENSQDAMAWLDL